MIRPRLLTVLCFAGMMSLAIGLNLLPVFLVSIRDTFGGTAGLSGEELGRLGGTAFLGKGSGKGSEHLGKGKGSRKGSRKGSVRAFKQNGKGSVRAFKQNGD